MGQGVWIGNGDYAGARLCDGDVGGSGGTGMWVVRGCG